MNIRVCSHDSVTAKIVPPTTHVGVEVGLLQCVGAELSLRDFKLACLVPPSRSCHGRVVLTEILLMFSLPSLSNPTAPSTVAARHKADDRALNHIVSPSIDRHECAGVVVLGRRVVAAKKG